MKTPRKKSADQAGPSPADEAAANPFKFFPVVKVREIFDFGKDVMTAILKHREPPLIIAKKMNPRMLMEWLEKHGHEIGKIRPE